MRILTRKGIVRVWTLFALLAVSVSTGCSPAPKTPVLVPLPTSVVTPTRTLKPTKTPTQTRTPTPAASPTPTLGRSDTPYPLPGDRTAVSTAYPLPTLKSRAARTLPPYTPQEPEMSPSDAIAILKLDPDIERVRISGTSTLPDGACIVTTLAMNGAAVDWWPIDKCAKVSGGWWTIITERPAFGPLDPPGASYEATAQAPDHPEAGVARYRAVLYIPYDSKGD